MVFARWTWSYLSVGDAVNDIPRRTCRRVFVCARSVYGSDDQSLRPPLSHGVSVPATRGIPALGPTKPRGFSRGMHSLPFTLLVRHLPCWATGAPGMAKGSVTLYTHVCTPVCVGPHASVLLIACGMPASCLKSQSHLRRQWA